ncbi:MAG: hypothetical protein M1305_00250 [Candidatus Marsarchaeota archaeon]|nr:hypothetical protein [Candidatus Marsarchaeota archaeon]
MAEILHNWQRFWHPLGTNLQFDNEGFLADPEAEYGSWRNPHAVPFEAVCETECLILLGEQGIGKSTAITQAVESVDVDHCLSFDTAEFQTDALLKSDIFDKREFQQWRDGDYILYLFLDSLDEGVLTPDIIVDLLSRELAGCPTKRLRLRLACRTAAWPADLEGKLKKLWAGADRVKTYELAPLREKDAEEAARESGLDEKAFLREVHEKEVVYLAARPLTLKMLFAEYSKSQQLSSRIDDLMHSACLRLCEDTTFQRRQCAKLSVKERLAVAGRIAAVTVLADKASVWCGLDNPPEDDASCVGIYDLCGGDERVPHGDEIKVSESAIREVIATGLFSSRGANRMGWCHRSYAEYLAARYLVDHMALGQIMSLLTRSNDSAKQFVPQLNNVAAWLAVMNSDLASAILVIDPMVLLQCYSAAFDGTARAKAVEGLLEFYERTELHPSFNPQYRKLGHPGLEDQIKPFMCNQTKHLSVRYTAVDIAEACKLVSLHEELIRIALDPDEPYALRINSAGAVTRICSDEVKARLKPLALGEAGDDPDDELKGCGLRALWPSSISAKDLFSLLTFPKNPNLLGAYRAFCIFEAMPHLHPNDLPVALEWARIQPGEVSSHWGDKLIEGILTMAWGHLDNSGVVEGVAAVIISQLRETSEAFVPTDDEGCRRKVARAIMSTVSDSDFDPTLLCFCGRPLLTNLDLHWLLEELNPSLSEKDQRFIATIILYVADVYRQPNQLDAVLIACQENRILAEVFADLITPVELGSDRARRMEDNYARAEQRCVRNSEAALFPPPSERVALRLKECQGGNLMAWCDLNRQLTLESDSTHYGDLIESDLTLLPGWTNASDSTRAEIAEAAENYIRERIPEPADWLGTDLVVNYPADYSGYRALCLLCKEAHDILDDFPVDIWSRWAAVILAGYDLCESPCGLDLVRQAYKKAPDDIIEALLELIDRDNYKHGSAFVIRKLTQDLWDVRIARTLLTKITDKKLNPDSAKELFRCLLLHADEAATDYAADLVCSHNSRDDVDYALAVAAGQMLMSYAGNVGWSTVWPVAKQDDDFGSAVLNEVIEVYSRDSESSMSTLQNENLADLYIWVVHHYPYEEYSIRGGAVDHGTRMAMWRNTAIRMLQQRGASDTIKRIAQEFPDLAWLRRIVSESEIVACYNSWVPPKPKDILSLAESKEHRVVRNGKELLDAIEESLHHLQSKLKNETPAVIFLWDHLKDRSYKPKDESALSDFVKIHLDDDLRQRGIVCNREVEIRRPRGSTPGERTDIQVSAFSRDKQGNPLNTIKVIIEVKGCWHKNLGDAMQTQLASRYIRENDCHHGLYLVGWFDSKYWSEGDHRRGDKPKQTIDEAKKQFKEQADQLSLNGREIRAYVLDASLG